MHLSYESPDVWNIAGADDQLVDNTTNNAILCCFWLKVSSEKVLKEIFTGQLWREEGLLSDIVHTDREDRHVNF